MRQFQRCVLLFVCAVFCTLISCRTTNVAVYTESPDPYPAPLSTTGISIGFARESITPPPGYPMCGYSFAGKFSRGKFNELYATSTVVIDQSGTPLVLVATDLWGMPRGLKHKVLELLRREFKIEWLGMDDVLMTAIHTHHGPGAYVPDQAFALGSPGFAFDEAMYLFLARGIAKSIDSAIKDVKSGRALSTANTIVQNVIVNRSMLAFNRNPVAERSLPSVDSTLKLVFVSSGDTLKSISVVMNVHPTAIGDQGELYSADMFGIARDLVEAQMPGVIVSFINGADGDQAPLDINRHDRAKAFELANRIAESIIVAARGQRSAVSGEVRHYTKEVPLSYQRVNVKSGDEACFCQFTSQPMHTAENALVGVAALGGASDGRTTLYHLGMREGVRYDQGCDPDHGVKLAASNYVLDSVVAFGLDGRISPVVADLVNTKPSISAPISIHSIGSIAFVGVPGEFTVALSRRILDSARASSAFQNSNMIFCGLADDYASYVTTPCEYAEQAYEGAATYWGPNMGMLFAQSFATLAKSKARSEASRHDFKTNYAAGQQATFGPNTLERHRGWDATISLQPYIMGDTVIARDWTDLSDTMNIDVSRGSSIRIRFRSAYAELKSNGKTNNEEMYPNVEIQNESGLKIKCPQTGLSLDNIIPPVAEWSFWIFDSEKMEKGMYKVFAHPFGATAREFRFIVH